jgi:hypothetical protein
MHLPCLALSRERLDRRDQDLLPREAGSDGWRDGRRQSQDRAQAQRASDLRQRIEQQANELRLISGSRLAEDALQMRARSLQGDAELGRSRFESAAFGEQAGQPRLGRGQAVELAQPRAIDGDLAVRIAEENHMGEIIGSIVCWPGGQGKYHRAEGMGRTGSWDRDQPPAVAHPSRDRCVEAARRFGFRVATEVRLEPLLHQSHQGARRAPWLEDLARIR